MNKLKQIRDALSIVKEKLANTIDEEVKTYENIKHSFLMQNQLRTERAKKKEIEKVKEEHYNSEKEKILNQINKALGKN